MLITYLKNRSLAKKISLLGALSVLIATAALLMLAVWQSHQYHALAQKEVDALIESDLDHLTQGVYNLVQTENEAIRQQLSDNLKVARHLLAQAGPVTLSKETTVWTATQQLTRQPSRIELPKMLIGGRWPGQITDPSAPVAVVDSITQMLGETATLFQRMNERGDMLRVATTVKTEDGKRAIGTYIPAIDSDGSPNPVIASVRKGRTYLGRAYVVNAWYLTSYEPINDSAGRLVGMLYVGIKQKTVEARIRQAILQTKVGKTGYVYVLGGKGVEKGRYIISQRGERDGENIWDTQDNHGRYVIQAIINKAVTLKPGELATEHYPWKNPGETAPRWKIARLAYYEPWDWVIGASTYDEEFQPYQKVLTDGRNRMITVMSLAGLIITLLIGLSGILVASTIIRPIRQLTDAVETISQGNLKQRVDISSRDEIGTLARLFNVMTCKLDQTMKELQDGAHFLQTLLDAIPNPIFYKDTNCIYRGCNLAFESYIGLSKDQIVGKSVYDIAPHNLAAQYEEKDRVLLETGGIQIYESSVRYADHSLHDVVFYKATYTHADGSLGGLVGIILDITERKKKDDTIREINERFKSVLRAATTYSIIATDADGIIKVFNEGSERMLGYHADELIDQKTPVILHDPEEVASRAAELGISPGFEVFVTLARQGAIDTRDWTYIRKDGARLTVSLTVTAMRSETGVLTGFIGFGRDVSAERQMEQMFIQSQKMESLGLLAGGVAHDFNNLLTPIIGYAELLMMTSSKDAPYLTQLEQIHQAANHAKDLTLRLLAFSRKQIIELKTVQLGEVIQRSEKMLRRIIRENIQILVKIAPDLVAVRADSSQIDQVLLNLALNAQDAMPEGGALTVEAANLVLEKSYAEPYPEVPAGRYVLLTVSDIGMGMDKKTLAHIFEPFFTTKELGKGTGLGLSTVYGIIKQHGGVITVTSEKSKGTAFQIFLPQADDQKPAIDSSQTSTERIPHGLETILVAEDNEMVRTLTCSMLESLGYYVLAASSPDQCAGVIKSHPGKVHLLLTDVIMPKMNGRELFEQLRLTYPGLRVLFMSGYTSDVIGHHGVLDEDTHFIQKPFTLQALAEKLRKILD